MKILLSYKQLALAAFTVLLTASRLGAQLVQPASFEYDWVGGKPGFSGKIFLNAPTSALASDGGTDSDVLAGSYITTPLGTYNVVEATPPPAFVFNPNLGWNHTQITFMDLFFQPSSPIIDPYFQVPSMAQGEVNSGDVQPGEAIEISAFANGGLATIYAEDDFTGQWLAVSPVPEPNTLALIAGGGLLFALCRPIRRMAGCQ